MKTADLEKIKRAGEIHHEVCQFARKKIRKGIKLLELAEQIESEIKRLGGKCAFPVNLSKNEIAAHATPSWNDEELANGLLKVDVGVHIDGYVADGAFTVDLEDNDENKKLIRVAETALNEGINKIRFGLALSELGREIENVVKKEGLITIRNLTGHSIERHNLHAGLSIPNYDSGQQDLINEGIYALEPFTTNGAGRVRDGKPSGIFILSGSGNVRDSFAREVLKFIDEEYEGLPFCSRWIYKKFGSKGLLALRQIEQAGIINQYNQLIESANGKVAQAEHTILITKKEKIVITLLDKK